MAAIEVLGTGLVFRGSADDDHFRNAHFPSVVELDDGQLVAAMDIGQRMCARDVRSYCCRSSDGGQTWSRPRLMFEPDESEHPVTTTCRISRCGDGQLLGIAQLTDRSRPGEVLSNPQTDGSTAGKLALIKSGDGGETWAGPATINPPIDWSVWEICSVIMPLDADRWLLPTAIFPDWDGRAPLGVKAMVLTSEDQGRSWGRTTDVFDFWDRKTTAWEQKQTVLSDGRLLSVCWCFNYATKQDEPNRFAISHDRGETYGPARDTPLRGQTCSILGLEDNHVLCVYRRLDKRGLWAHLARVEGDNWQAIADAPLWGTDVDAIAGGGDSSLRNLHKLQFGFPTLIRQKNGDVFFVFWCVEDGLSVIRWYRLAVSA
jgi:sialidase-1